jgi:hypothetical protein
VPRLPGDGRFPHDQLPHTSAAADALRRRERQAVKFFTNGTWKPRLPSIPQVPTPVGDTCLLCDAAIEADDCGLVMMHMAPDGDAYRPQQLVCFRAAIGIEGAKS